jgi:hypothetical protein
MVERRDPDRELSTSDIAEPSTEGEPVAGSSSPPPTEGARPPQETVGEPAAGRPGGAEMSGPGASGERDDASVEPLIDPQGASALQQRWEAIQGSFVDEPRRSVEQADSLVAEALQQVAQSFSSARERLEGQWSRGDDVSTEDLRQTLQRYRSFFHRLLSV